MFRKQGYLFRNNQNSEVFFLTKAKKSVKYLCQVHLDLQGNLLMCKEIEIFLALNLSEWNTNIRYINHIKKKNYSFSINRLYKNKNRKRDLVKFRN